MNVCDAIPEDDPIQWAEVVKNKKLNIYALWYSELILKYINNLRWEHCSRERIV